MVVYLSDWRVTFCARYRNWETRLNVQSVKGEIIPSKKKKKKKKKKKITTKACIVRSTFCSLVTQFRMGRTSVRNNLWPGCPDEAVNLTMVANVEVFVNKDRRVTLHGVTDQLSIGKPSEHQIFTKKIRMSNVSARDLCRNSWEEKQNKQQQKTKKHENRRRREWPILSVGMNMGSLCWTGNKSSVKAMETSWFTTFQDV